MNINTETWNNIPVCVSEAIENIVAIICEGDTSVYEY